MVTVWVYGVTTDLDNVSPTLLGLDTDTPDSPMAALSPAAVRLLLRMLSIP